MIYSLNYYSSSKYKDIVEELKIKFMPGESKIFDLVRFIKGHENQRIFILLQSWATFQEYSEAIGCTYIELFNQQMSAEDKKKYDFTFCIDDDPENYRWSDQMTEISKVMKEYNLPFCFRAPVDNFDILIGQLDLGVTDITITGDLGFNLEAVSKLVKDREQGQKIRCYPDVRQSNWNGLNPALCFWIRPENIKDYEPYIDVLEFWKDSMSFIQADLLYNIYAEKGYWNGSLSYVIEGMPDWIDNKCILGNICNRRPNCGRKCIKGHNCNVCFSMLDLAKSMKDNHLIFREGNEE